MDKMNKKFEELYKNKDYKFLVDVGMNIREFFRAIKIHEFNLIKDYDITPIKFNVLKVLGTKGIISINLLIEELISTYGNMTYVISSLEKSGLVYRKTNPNDKRSFLIEISEKGRKIVESIFPKHLEFLKEMFSDFSEEDKENMLILLKKIKK